MQTLLDTLVRLSRRWTRSGSSTPSPSADVDKRELKPGERWGQFQIIAKLGKGSFGSVYHAIDALERDVALKLLKSPEAIREGRLLAQVKHPNIVAVHGYEQGPDGVALSMELIQGQNLEQFLNVNGKLDSTHATVIGTSLCQALATVHGRGLIHRDVKATNVMRQSNGRIVLVDFGLGQSPARESQASEIAGTLPYMAPELFEGNPASVRSDLYAVGILLYYLVSLQYPVIADGYKAFHEEHRSQRKTHLLDICPDLPPQFIRVVEVATDPDPRKRFRSAGAMATALEEILQSRPRRSRTLTRPAMVAVGLVSAGLAAWLGSQWLSNVPEPVFTRITNANALSQEPTLSADGKLVAYSSDEGEPGNLDIFMRQVPNGEAVRLTSDPSFDSTPAFSSDGHMIAFRSERDGGGIYVIQAFGHREKLLAKGGYAPRFSPDGRYIAYYVGEPWQPRMAGAKLYVIPVEGGTAQHICPEMADARNPVWAPDSQHILFEGSTDPNLPPMGRAAEWFVADLSGSPPLNSHALQGLQSQGLQIDTYSTFWQPGYLVFAATQNENLNIWRTRFSIWPFLRVGKAQRVTSGSGFEASPWVADDGSIAFGSLDSRLQVWAVPLDGVKRQPERVTNTAGLDAFPSLSRDERFMSFTRTAQLTGSLQVWIRDLKTGEESVITNTRDSKGNAVMSPDGARIAYSILGANGNSVYVVDRVSRERRLICEGCGLVTAWSAKGDSLLISTDAFIQTLDLHSNIATPLLSRKGVLIDEGEWSPDQKWLAFTVYSKQQERQVFVAATDKLDRWIPMANVGGWSEKPHWSPDGKTLYFYSLNDGFVCIWSRSFDRQSGLPAGPVRPVYHLHNARLGALDISQTRRSFAVTATRIYCNLSEESGTIWLSTGKN